MNLVGKIFTVLIFVMALVFMAFSVAVYATHKNWRDAVMLSRDDAPKQGKQVGVKWQLEDARALNKKLKDEHDRLKEKSDEAELRMRNTLLKLTDELKKQRADNAAMQEENKTINQEKADAIQTVGTQQQLNLKLRTENDSMRDAKRTAEKTRDAKMDELITKTGDLIQAETELRRAKENMARTAADLANARQVLRMFKLKEDPKAYDNLDVDGVVLAAQGGGLIEISIGSDDGLNVGAMLRIFRADGSMYLGQAQVLRTAPDKSVCKVLPETRKGVITRGDRVYSGINERKGQQAVSQAAS